MQDKDLREITLQSEEKFSGPIFRVTHDIVSLPDGSTAFRDVVRHKGAVCVLPLTKEGDVILARQYRQGTSSVTLEIPAGKLDTVNEDHAAAAARELEEETGARAGKWIFLGDYYGSPAILEERIVMFLATDLSFGACHPDADEFLEPLRLPLSTLVDMALRGEIPDGKTQCAVLRTHLMLERGLL